MVSQRQLAEIVHPDDFGRAGNSLESSVQTPSAGGKLR
jgi:hypothetical protein